MKNSFLTIWIILFTSTVFGQVDSGAMPMDSINGMTIPTCSGLFSDSGGHFEHC